MMHVELSVSLNFVISYLYNKLPRRRVDLFGEELEKALCRKFEGHWYPDKPVKGSAYRSCKLTGNDGDPVMEEAAINCGLEVAEIKSYLPSELTVWIDPGEVSYRIGEKGVVKILYSAKEAADIGGMDNEINGFNPDAQSFRPIDAIASSLGNLTLSPAASVTPPEGQSSPMNVATFLNRTKEPIFTTASFAQTKFGSTKLKTVSKRPTRLSPTDAGVFMPNGLPGPAMPPQISPPQPNLPFMPQSGPSPARSKSLSPNEPHNVNDLLEQQQRLFYQQLQFSQSTSSLQQQPSSNTNDSTTNGLLNDIFSGAGFPSSVSHTNLPSNLGNNPTANPNYMDLLNQQLLNNTFQQQQQQQQMQKQQQLMQRQQQLMQQHHLQNQLQDPPLPPPQQQQQQRQQPNQQSMMSAFSQPTTSLERPNSLGQTGNQQQGSFSNFGQHQQGLHSPDGGKNLLEGINLAGGVSPLSNLKHLLVAN